MVKKLAVIITAFLIFTLLAPAAALAAENQIIYGTIVSVDKEKNEIVVITEDGTEKTISVAGAGMQIGADHPLTIDDLQPGQIIGTMAQVSGDTIQSEKLTIVPDFPPYTHITGVVTGQSGGGIKLQTKDGEIPCNLPGDIGQMQLGEAVTTIIEIPVGVNPDEYVKEVLAGQGIPDVTSFEPFSDTIKGIGNNLQQLGNDSPIKPEQVAIQMVNELGAMTQNVPEQTKTQLQETLGKTIETSMPAEAWTNMNQEAIQNMNSEGAGFIPPTAFGQMPTEVFGQMPTEAFGQMQPEAFGQMKPEAFGQMQPEAFGQMQPEAFGQMQPAAFGQMKPEAFANILPEAFSQMKPVAVAEIPPEAFAQIQQGALDMMKPDAAGQINPDAGSFMPEGTMPPGWTIAPDGGPMPPGAPGGGTPGGTPPAGGGGTPPAGGGGTPPAGGGGTPPADGGGTPPAGGGGTPPADGGGTPPAGGGGTPPAGGGGTPPAGGGGMP